MMATLTHPLWSAPFRPFFLLAACFALFNPLLWTLEFFGHIELQTAFSSTLNWHIHEMLFGFSWAVLTGFLFTAGAMWTGKKMIRGEFLLFLVSFWVMGRCCSFFSSGGVIVTNICFATFVLGALWNLLSGNRNRYILFPYLCLLAAGQVCFLLGDFWDHGELSQLGKYLGMAALLGIIIIMSGRLVPFFSQNRFGLEIKKESSLQLFFCLLPLFVLVIESFYFFPTVCMVLYLFGALIHFFRLIQWKASPRIFSDFMIGILHIGQFCIATFFLLKGISFFGFIDSASIHHVFTIGVLGIFCLGMMTRVSKGHTGRKMEATFSDIFIFLALVVGLALRVMDTREGPLLLSAFIWFLGLFSYVLSYVPILTKERL